MALRYFYLVYFCIRFNKQSGTNDKSLITITNKLNEGEGRSRGTNINNENSCKEIRLTILRPKHNYGV